jgi:hypothetical protein
MIRHVPVPVKQLLGNLIFTHKQANKQVSEWVSERVGERVGEWVSE